MDNKYTEELKMLYDAVLCLENEEECAALFEDLFTISELKAAVQRMTIADMLYHRHTCGNIAESTGASTATVSRVNKSLNYGAGGYRLVQKRFNNKDRV